MSDSAPRKVLSQLDCVAMVVGLVIGTGIFSFPSLVAGQLGDPNAILAVWILGGVLSAIGALCYAELATAYPSPGGEYHFLVRAYGRNVGFMFAWARLTVIQSGSIGLFAYIFGDYAAQLLPLGAHGPLLYAGLTVIALTALNLAGIRQTQVFQKVLFIASLAGLGVLVLAGVAHEGAMPANTPAPPFTAAEFGAAMLLVLLTFGGWNEAAYVSAEVREPERNIVRALLIAIAIITVVYAAVNFAYLQVLGPSGVAASRTVAADVMREAFGAPGAVIITFVILVLILDNTNITLFTGARSAHALGQDFVLFRFLDRWDGARGVPTRGVLFQGALALIIVLCGGVTRSGIQAMVDFLQPVFWTFFLLTGMALFVLRRRHPDIPRPFRTPLYPLTPALFCATAAFMLYSSIVFTGRGALAGIGVLLLGVPVLVFARRFPGRGRDAPTAPVSRPE